MKEHFGDVFAEHVRRTELTAGRLSKLTDISGSTIESWLEGRVRKPRRWQDVITLAAALRLWEEDANRLMQAAGWPTVTELISQAQRKQDTATLNLLSYWLTLRGHQKTDPDPLSPTNETTVTTVGVYFNHETIPAVGPLPTGSRLPFAPNPFFVGRQSEMRALAQALTTQAKVGVNQPVALIGLGGIGKTQLAIEFAHRYGRFFPGGVFWLNFFDPTTIPKQIATCGDVQYLNLQPEFDELPQVKQIKLVQRSWQSAVPRLLIFDGCEDEATLQQWCPTTGGCRVIITSRRGRWSPGLGVTPLSLPVLPRSEAQHFLRHFRHDLTRSEAEAIAQYLGDHPLALHLAGNFLRTYCHDVSSASYLSELQNSQAENLLKHPSLQGYGAEYSPTGQELHVGRTIALSYEKLDHTQELDRLALALLARVAWFAPGDCIPRTLLAATVASAQADKLQLASALTRLVNLGLVNEGMDGAVQVHQLVAAFVQTADPEQAAQADVEAAVLASVQHLEETLNPAPLRIWESQWRYITTAAFLRNSDLAAPLGHYLAIYLWLSGLYDEARKYCEQALLTRKKIKGTNHLDTADSLNLLGLLLKEMGLYEAALPHYKQALSIRETILGTEHTLTAKILNNIGSLLLATGNFEEACGYYERALAIKEKVLGPMHQELGTTLNNLGCLLAKMGDYENAQAALERALTIDEMNFGSEHPQVAMDLNNLGALLHKCDNYEKAHATLERALAIFERTLDAEHPLTAKVLYHLGVLYRDMAQLEKSENYLKRALAIRKQKLGLNHPETADILNILNSTSLSKPPSPLQR